MNGVMQTAVKKDGEKVLEVKQLNLVELCRWVTMNVSRNNLIV